MTYSAINIVAKARKAAFGLVVNKNERVKAYINSEGKARMVRNPNIVFKPNEYEIFISDEQYTELLTSDD